MITRSLENILNEKGIEIDKKIPKEVFLQKQQYILNLFQSAGYESVAREIVLFFCYFNGRQIPHKGHMIEFNLEHLMKYFPKKETEYSAKLLEKQIIPLGIMQSGWYDLFADENGKVYALHIEGDELILYGENPFVALENILKNNPLETKRI